MPALWLAFIFTPLIAYAENKGILTEITIPPGGLYMVLDVLDGVAARYRTTAHPDIYGEFSCAGYVKAYYEAVHGVLVDNLTDLGPPRGRALSEGDVQTREIFVQVYVPQQGDIIFYPKPPARNNHSAIVKSFDGELVTLIEQNFKWAQDGGTYSWLNRTIPYDYGNNPYQIWRLSHVPEQPFPTPVPVSPPFPENGGDDPPYEPIPSPVPDFYIDNNPVIFEIVFNIDETVPVFFEEPPPPPFFNEVVVRIGAQFISVNDDIMHITAPPYIENNRTMLPVRYVSYALGLSPHDLVWDGAGRSVTVYNGNDEIRFNIDSEILFVNGQPRVMDSMAVLKDGVTYLPVRFLAEAMDVFFEWDEEMAAVLFYY
jgi:hypothetical protein